MKILIKGIEMKQHLLIQWANFVQNNYVARNWNCSGKSEKENLENLPNTNSQTEILQVCSPAPHEWHLHPLCSLCLEGSLRFRGRTGDQEDSYWETRDAQSTILAVLFLHGISCSEMAAWEGTTNPCNLSSLNRGRHTVMWEPGLPDGQEKERQKLTRVMMVSDTHMEHLSHRCSGGRRCTFRRGRAVLGWKTPFVNVSIFYPPVEDGKMTIGQ